MGKQLVQNIAFDHVAKTVTLSDYTTLSLQRLLLIADATANEVLYNFTDPTKGASVAGNVITLDTDTSALADTDALIVIYDSLDTDPAYPGEFIAGVRKEVTFSTTTAQAGTVTDVSNYAWVSVHITGQGTGSNITFQCSNDNVNWQTMALMTAGSIANSPAVSTGLNTGVFHGPVVARYFRLNVTGITAGTTTGTIEFFSQPKGFPSVSAYIANSTVAVSGTATVQGGVTDGAVPGPTTLRVAGWDGTNVRTLRTAPSGYLQMQVYDSATSSAANNVGGADSNQEALLTAGNRKEVAFSTTTAQAVAATDVSNYAWVSVYITSQGTASTITYQVSNDNVNWTPIALMNAQNATVAGTTSSAGTGLVHGPLPGRYFRINVTGISAGTTAGVIEFFSSPKAMQSMGVGASISSTVNPSDSMGNVASTLHAAQLVYNGSTWDRQRTPGFIKTVATATAGLTPMWTPGAAKRFRVMRYKVEVTNDAAMAGGGDLDISLFDGAGTDIGLTQSLYVPATGGTTLGSWSTGWVDLGNGYLSTTANNALRVNLSAALTAGKVRVLVVGTEE